MYTPEWWSLYLYQYAIKTDANSLYGYFAFKSGREFMFEIPEAITTSARFTIKKCVLYAKNLGWASTHGDTDSAYLIRENSDITTKELEVKYFDFFNKFTLEYNTNCRIELKHPILKEKVLCNHFIVFEHEKTMDVCLVEKKKKYYYKLKDVKTGEFLYETKGGKYKKADTIEVAAKLQKEMVRNILDYEFNQEIWIKKLLDLKEKVFAFKLEKEVLVKTIGISKNIDDYGKPVIDGDTGKQKIRKSDDEPMFSPIPAHIKIALEERKKGVDIEVGDKISYIVLGRDGKKIVPISVDDYEKRQVYDRDYYWSSITSGLIEVLEAFIPKQVYKEFGVCWVYNNKQLNRLHEKLFKIRFMDT